MAKTTSKNKKSVKTKPKKKSTKPAKSTKTKAKKPSRAKGVFVAVLAAVLALCIGITVVYVHSDQQKPFFMASFGKDVVDGVDVSSHNGSIDWQRVSKQVDFAIIRVGYRGYGNGEICLDKKARKNLKQANKAGIPVGVYFYSQAITPEEAREEAEFTLDIIRRYNVSLPVFFDFEYAEKNGGFVGRLQDANLSSTQTTQLVNSFCDTVEEAGYNSGVYASSYVYRSIFKTRKINKSTTIWVADYNKQVTYVGDYDIWQYTSKGKCDGIKSKHVDWNHWYVKK